MVEPLYVSYDSKVTEVLKNFCANSATLRTLTGAANPTAMLAFIIENEGGLPGEVVDVPTLDRGMAVDGSVINLLTAHVVIDTGPIAQDEGHVLTYRRHTGQSTVRVVLPPTADDEPAWRFRRITNLLGSAQADFVALQGTAGYFINMGIETQVTRVADLSDERGKNSEGELLISWSDV